jgi:hypothetical protein
MNASAPEQIPLWQEGFRLFGRFWRPWLKEAAWFVLVWAGLYFSLDTFFQNHMDELNAAVKEHKGLPPGWAEMLFLMWSVFFLAILVQSYVFKIFFLKRAPITAPPVASLGGFLSYLAVYVKVALCLLVVGLGLAASIMLARLLGNVAPVLVVKVIVGVLLLAGAGVIYYIAIKLSPAFTLAAARIVSPVKTGWHLLDGNWWRVFGNVIVAVFLVALPYFAVLVVGGLILKTLPDLAGGSAAVITRTLVAAVFQVVMAGIVAAFYCSLCRILYEEKRRADPSFALTTKP